MIDVHSHLNFPTMKDNLDEIIKDAKEKMEAVITCGLVNDLKESVELHKNNKNFIYLTLGIHPEDVEGMRNEQLEKHMDLIREHKNDIVGIGEIGLDYHWIKEENSQKRCKNWFRIFLNLAKEMNLPVILHSRKAEKDTFETVLKTDLNNVVFHHFSGNVTLAKEIIDSGYYISMSTITPTNKNLLKIAERFPLENLVTETDSPFNSPFTGKINVPQNINVTINKIAEKKEMEPEEVDKILTKNAKKIFLI